MIHAKHLGSPAQWTKLSVELWELGVTAPWVIWLRSEQFALAAGRFSAADHREFHRMFDEKFRAGFDSWLALQRGSLKLAAALASGGAFDGTSLALLGRSGLRPMHRRVRANSKRLTGRRRGAG